MTANLTDFDVAYTKTFWDSLHSLAPADQQRCTMALLRFSQDPQNPGLRFGPLTSDRNDRWKIRAAQQLRIILERTGNIFFVLLAGQRQDVYDRASRLRGVLNRGSGRYVYVEQQPKPAVPPARERPPQRSDDLGVIPHWTNRDLADTGLTEEQVVDLRQCRSEDDLLDLLNRGWVDDDVELVIDLLGQTPEDWRNPSLILEEDAVEMRIRSALDEFGALHGISRLLTPSELEHLASAPIEEWMIFLHPDQGSVVDAEYAGPARVRGPVGTGKTVVAIHRAAALASRYADEKILFTTFVKSLPPVFKNLHRRLPNARPDQVEFVNIDRLARMICDRAGQAAPVITDNVDAAWAAACRSIVRPGTPLAGSRLSRYYLREEIVRVIKGLALPDAFAYRAVERRGRRMPLTTALRDQVWELRDAWDAEMVKRETVDFADVLLKAVEIASASTPMYRAAIVDESQDLTLAGLRLIQQLIPSSGEAPDGLFLVGDAAQRIYAGGFSLAQAGIEIRGRSTVLEENYRNTAEILNAALDMCGGRQIQDLEDEYDRAAAAVVTARRGTRPLSVDVPAPIDQYTYIAKAVEAMGREQHGIGVGDIAVFSPTNRLAQTAERELASRGIPVETLQYYAGTTTSKVKVGTFHRAKGLEFKCVFVTDLGAAFPKAQKSSTPSSEYDDYLDLTIASLFVAMTRARDVLVLLSPTGRSKLLDHAKDSTDIAAVK